MAASNMKKPGPEEPGHPGNPPPSLAACPRNNVLYELYRLR